METLKIALLFATVAINCASAGPTRADAAATEIDLGATTEPITEYPRAEIPAPTSVPTAEIPLAGSTVARQATTPATVRENPLNNGTTVKITFSSALVKTLFEEDKPSRREKPALEAVARLAGLAAYQAVQAATSNAEAQQAEMNEMKQANLKYQAAQFRLLAEQNKRKAALLTRQIIGASNGNETQVLKQLAEFTLGRRNANEIPYLGESIDQILKEISPAALGPDQVSSAITEIKSLILENAAMLNQEETMEREIKKQTKSQQDMVLDRKRATLKKEREAKGAEIRNRLMRLANKQEKNEIQNRINQLEAEMQIPIYE